MTIQLLRKKFTVEQYHQMMDSGILTESDRVELLQGEIIEMSPIGRQHAACVDRLTELFIKGLAGRAIIRVQNPIHLSKTSEPQPDLAILQRRSDFYANRHPQPPDIFALIEVADTTIEFDRTIKVPMYAKDNIPEVWIIALHDQAVHVYREPNHTGYQHVQTCCRGQSLTFQSFTDVQFSIDSLLG